MTGKRFFTIEELWFNLPETFEGTFGDALLLLAQYRKEEESKNQQDKSVLVYEDRFSTLWGNENIKCSMGYALCELKEDLTWESQPDWAK